MQVLGVPVLCPCDDELAAAEGDILLRRLLVHPHGPHDRRDVHIVVVQGGIGGPLPDGVQRRVHHILRGVPVETQGKLWLHIAQLGRGAQAQAKENVRLGGVSRP